MGTCFTLPMLPSEELLLETEALLNHSVKSFNYISLILIGCVWTDPCGLGEVAL